MRLEDRTAIVTGASDGIGRAIAIELAKEGADVAIGDVKPETDVDKTPTSERVREHGRHAVFERTDISKRADVENLVSETVDQLGEIDILVNNAGIFPREARGKTVEDISESLWTEIFAVNVRGTFLCTQCVMPFLRESDTGRVINIASQLGLVGVPQAPAYCASKGAVINFTRQLAVDYADDRVTCNAICPGFVVTGTKEYRLADERSRDLYESNTLLPYFGEPTDIGRAAAFLASDDARFMTGQCLVVDGGWTAR